MNTKDKANRYSQCIYGNNFRQLKSDEQHTIVHIIAEIEYSKWHNTPWYNARTGL